MPALLPRSGVVRELLRFDCFTRNCYPLAAILPRIHQPPGTASSACRRARRATTCT